MVTLSIVCNNETFSADLHLECSDSHHDFFTTLNPYNLVGLRYICSEGTVFNSNSLASDVHIIPNVSITTDEYWQNNAPEFCYRKSIDLVAPPVTVIAPAPTFSPIQATTQPETAPTEVPEIRIPVTAPSGRLIIVPPLSTTSTLSPSFSILNNDTSSKGDSEKGDDKVLIFSAVGGVVCGIIISGLLFMVYKKGKNDGVVEHKVEPYPPRNDFNDTENNTESQYCPSIQQSSNPTDTISPMIVTTASLVSPVVTTSSDFYEVHYKDQSRTVIGTASGRTPSGRSSSDNKTPPVVARYYNADIADIAKHTKPTSGIEIPTVPAMMCTDISLLGESDSSIRRLADSNSSLRMIGESNRSFRFPSESNRTIPTESNTDNVKMAPSTSSHLAESNSSLRMIGESNRSFQILDDFNSAIPIESNTERSNYDRKRPAFDSAAVEL